MFSLPYKTVKLSNQPEHTKAVRYRRHRGSLHSHCVNVRERPARSVFSYLSQVFQKQWLLIWSLMNRRPILPLQESIQNRSRCTWLTFGTYLETFLFITISCILFICEISHVSQHKNSLVTVPCSWLKNHFEKKNVHSIFLQYLQALKPNFPYLSWRSLIVCKNTLTGFVYITGG